MESTFSVAERPAQRGRPEGGFALVLVWQLCRVWDRYKQGELRFADVRCWMALCEAQERRCGLEEGRAAFYSVEELERLTGDSGRTVRASLQRLEAQGLATLKPSAIAFGGRKLDLDAEPSSLAVMLELVENHRRAVPVPRRTLRMLAQCGKPAVVATALGHLFRCVYYRTGQVVSWGRCKSSWVADAFNIDDRSVKAARSHLLSLGWLVKLPNLNSHVVKRWGGEYQVELRWERPTSYVADDGGQGGGTGFSSLPPGSGAGFSPRSNKSPLPTGEIQHQTPDGVGMLGAKAKRGEGAVGRRIRRVGEPTLRHVERQDLVETARTLLLFEQAGQQGLISRSEHGRLTFVGLAEHALLHGTRNPGGLFVTLLREKRYGYLTQDDEDAARRRINRELYPAGPRRPVKTPVPTPRGEPSKHSRLAQAIERVARDKRLAPITVIRAMKLDWSMEHYVLHLEGAM